MIEGWHYAVHIWPVDDLTVHQLENCVCQPRIELTTDGETPVNIHHSLDGRELSEPDYAGG